MKLKHARIAKAAISGRMIREIAADENVSERQVYRILQRPDVRSAIDGAAKEIVRSAETILKRGSEGAARALVEMADGTRAADRDRVAAARAVIEHTAGRPIQRAELTGKDGAALIPATKDAAIEALRAVVPAAALAVTKAVEAPTEVEAAPTGADPATS